MNYTLLQALLSAGAVTPSLTSAWREALIAQGATDGNLSTYLTSQGYTGTVSDAFMKYLGDKGYVGTLTDRLMAAAAANDLFDAGSSALDYAALFASYSANGWCYSGAASRSSFAQDTGGSTPCTTIGQPVAYLSDLSGNNNHATNSASGYEPVYYESAGGYKFWQQGEVGVNRWLVPANSIKASAAMTQIVCFAMGAGISGNGGIMISSYNNGWAGGSYHLLGVGDNTPTARGISLNHGSVAMLITDVVVDRALPGILVMNRSGTGTNESTISVYNAAGTLLSSVTGTQSAAGTSIPLFIGMAGAAFATQNFQFFNLMINASLSGADEAAVLADIVQGISVG